MIELAGRLVVPVAPGPACVDADRGALVAGDDHAFGVLRIDPDVVIVVAARRALEFGPVRAAVVGAAHRLAGRVDAVAIGRIGGDAAEVVVREPACGAHALPVHAGVVGAVQAAGILGGGVCDVAAVLCGVDHRVDAPAGSRGHADAAEHCAGPAVAGDARPGLAAVGRTVQAAAGSGIRREVRQPRIVADLPGRGIDDVGVGRIRGEIDGAGVGVDEQRALPGLAAVIAAEHAAFAVRAEIVAERRDQHVTGIARVDQDRADVARCLEPDVRPGLAAVGCLVDAVAGADIVARGDLAGADVDRVRLARRDGERTDVRGRHRVEHRMPGRAGVGRLPHAAAGSAEIIRVRPIGNALGDGAPAGAHRADQAPAQGLRRIVAGGLRAGAGERQQRNGERGKGRGGQGRLHAGHSLETGETGDSTPSGPAGGPLVRREVGQAAARDFRRIVLQAPKR